MRLIVMQGIGYPHPVVIRAEDSADGPVKIATVYHSASYMAQDHAERLAHCWNCHDELLEALRGLLDHSEMCHNTCLAHDATSTCRLCEPLRVAKSTLANAQNQSTLKG